MKKVLAFALSLCLLLSGVALAETGSETESSYTYNYSLPTFPTNWNPHQYKTNTDNDDMLRWLSDGFFEFDYNENEDGYTMVPSMVVGMLAPSPTAMTVPVCGFSLASEARNSPEAVVTSASSCFRMTRSPRGFKFIACRPFNGLRSAYAQPPI